MKNKIISAKAQILANSFLFLFYFVIASKTPYAGDDFRYKLNPLENEFNFRIFAEIIDFQKWHYLNWSGRVVPNFLLQVFLVPSKLIFNFFNAGVQVLLINIIFYFAYNRVAKEYKDICLLLLINLFLFIGFYKYSGFSIYLTSAISYTWTHFIVLIYYLPFWNFFINGKDYSKKQFFTIAGFIAGCTNEHVFIAQLYFFISLIILKRFSIIRELPRFFFSSFYGVLVGGLILIFSPGNYARATSQGSFLSFDSIIDYLIYDAIWFTSDIKPFWLMIILLVAFGFFSYKKLLHINKPQTFILSCGFISSLSMAFSPSYHSGTNLFFFICTIIFVLPKIDFSSSINLVSIINIILTLSLFLILHHNHSLIDKYHRSIEAEILSEKKKGKKDIIIQNIEIDTNRLVNYQALFSNPNSVRNMHIAKYYHVDSIISVEKAK